MKYVKYPSTRQLKGDLYFENERKQRQLDWAECVLTRCQHKQPLKAESLLCVRRLNMEKEEKESPKR